MARTTQLLIVSSLFILAGCGPSAPVETTTSIAQLHDAEIRIERKTGGSASATLRYERTDNVETTRNGLMTTRTNQWTESKTSMTGDAGPNTKCKVSGILTGHVEGKDVWELTLEYSTTDGALTTSRSQAVTVQFDGETPVTVAEDEHHRVVLQPPWDTGGASRDAGDPEAEEHNSAQ